MSRVVMQPHPTPAARVSVQDGPVLLASKPFNGLASPLAFARWVAERVERELRIVSVLEPTEGVVTDGLQPFPSRFYDDERTTLAAQIRLESVVADASPDSLRIDVLEGPTAEMVVDAARECGAPVIVVGTGRHDPIGRYVYGERALQIVGRADRPVLVVPRNSAAASISVAVVAVDFSQASVRAALAVLPLLAPGGRLIVVHVKPGAAPNEETVGWWNDVYERRCADLFAQFLRKLPHAPGVALESKFLRGDVVPTILGYAAEQGAGLVGCGRLGHSLIERALVGSVSSALVRQAAVPVLVAPELPGDTAWHG